MPAPPRASRTRRRSPTRSMSTLKAASRMSSTPSLPSRHNFRGRLRPSAEPDIVTHPGEVDEARVPLHPRADAQKKVVALRHHLRAQLRRQVGRDPGIDPTERGQAGHVHGEPERRRQGTHPLVPDSRRNAGQGRAEPGREQRPEREHARRRGGAIPSQTRGYGSLKTGHLRVPAFAQFASAKRTPRIEPGSRAREAGSRSTPRRYPRQILSTVTSPRPSLLAITR